jgi:hypothetical protein
MSGLNKLQKSVIESKKSLTLQALKLNYKYLKEFL